MTKTNPYLDTLLRAHQNPQPELPGMAELTQFCSAIAQYIGGLVECTPVPGALSNRGQEYKVILTFVPSSYSQTLVRAYLNDQAKPYLDVSDGKGPQKCRDVADLARRLQEYLTV